MEGVTQHYQRLRDEMARAQRTLSDSGSEVMEGQSGSEDQREEYFGEAGAPPVRRSERLLQKAAPEGGYTHTNLPPPYIEAMWVKVQREIPMRVWFVKQQNVCAYYGADGTKKDVTQEEMASLELPHAYVRRHWDHAIHASRCLHRAILKKLGAAARSLPLPSEEQWMEWVKPISPSMCVEFTCQSCGAICKTHNRYAPWVDGAENTGNANCSLFGRGCSSGDMHIPESLSHAHMAGIRPAVPQPSPWEKDLEDGMTTAREKRESPKKEVEKPASPVRRRRVRRPLLHESKFIRRMQRQRRQARREEESITPRRPPVVPPLATPLLGARSVTSDPPISLPPSPSVHQSSGRHEESNIKQQLGVLMEEMAALRMQMQQQQDSKSPRMGDMQDLRPPEDNTHAPSILDLEHITPHTPHHDDPASQWIKGLCGAKLKPMAKAMGKVVAATEYAGEPHPTTFAAWCDSVRSLMPMYDIPPGPSQVQVATWFIKGVVKDWWTGKCAAREYGSLQTLDEFFSAVEEEFQPSDAPEQCMEKWCTLKHTHSVAMYMNEVDALHNTWRLCEKAEFGWPSGA